ncbi:hypothetical protein VTO42DRAFT_2539 [Malbranchea cinnamomea]
MPLLSSRRSSQNEQNVERREDYGLPDFHYRFIKDDELREFEKALDAPETLSLVAINDWRPIHRRVRKPGESRRSSKRTKDETREGFVYTLVKWPLFITASLWIVVLSTLYVLTRLYIALYEHFVAWRGQRNRLRRALRSTRNYKEWKKAAIELDSYLGNDKWKDIDEYAYYDHVTISKVLGQLKQLRNVIDDRRVEGERYADKKLEAFEELRTLLEGCVKNNFVGIENPRLYSETYYGTKALVQEFVDEVHACLKLVLDSSRLSDEAKCNLFRHLDINYGRSVLCLSGGATFAYYHFGVVKALLDNGVLPEIISGTSGGALVAAMVATHTDSELKKLLVPELAHKINACQDGFATWIRRWWRTGARFDTQDWAEQCSWFCRGSTTFQEAYERTGRILNVSCVPSDPHSPTILVNYKTSPNCVIWSAVIASAAVPGILNPVVLMMKKPDGTLAPYSFGHKWKDGSLRTDIPLKALDVHFNASFPIVSQVNPHISLFFFSSRGSVGQPVTHRKGRGWRGGFLGSATEQYIKLDLNKWLKVLRHLELLPRPFGQDWSKIWLQRFSGTVAIWPKSIPSDLYYILSDPTPQRLARMLLEGQHSTFPKIKFISNRMRLEKAIAEGVRKYVSPGPDIKWRFEHEKSGIPPHTTSRTWENAPGSRYEKVDLLTDDPVQSSDAAAAPQKRNGTTTVQREEPGKQDSRLYNRRPSSMLKELRRQSAVFFDDDLDDTGPSAEDLVYKDESGTRVR